MKTQDFEAETKSCSEKLEALAGVTRDAISHNRSMDEKTEAINALKAEIQTLHKKATSC